MRSIGAVFGSRRVGGEAGVFIVSSESFPTIGSGNCTGRICRLPPVRMGADVEEYVRGGGMVCTTRAERPTSVETTTNPARIHLSI